MRDGSRILFIMVGSFNASLSRAQPRATFGPRVHANERATLLG